MSDVVEKDKEIEDEVQSEIKEELKQDPENPLLLTPHSHKRKVSEIAEEMKSSINIVNLVHSPSRKKRDIAMKNTAFGSPSVLYHNTQMKSPFSPERLYVPKPLQLKTPPPNKEIITPIHSPHKNMISPYRALDFNSLDDKKIRERLRSPLTKSKLSSPIRSIPHTLLNLDKSEINIIKSIPPLLSPSKIREKTDLEVEQEELLKKKEHSKNITKVSLDESNNNNSKQINNKVDDHNNKNEDDNNNNKEDDNNKNEDNNNNAIDIHNNDIKKENNIQSETMHNSP
ncbi:hypothetical protein WA158_000214 [Blastocystis sp. Blastoise]